MSNRIATFALISSTVAFATIASAATLVDYPTNPEHTAFPTASAPTATRAQVRQELAEFLRNPVTADNWKDVGGERGWVSVPHTYRFAAGKLEHTDACDHSTASMEPAKPASPSIYRDLYRNAV